MARRAAAAAPAARARRRSALQYGDQPHRGLCRQECANPHSDLGDLRGVLRLRRQGRHQAENLSDVRRPRPGAPCPRLLHAGAHLPELRRPRPVDRQPLRVMRRLRPGDPRADAVGEYSGRRRGRHPHPAWPARARPACAAVRPAISTFSCRSARIRSSSARAPICIAASRFPWSTAAVGGEFEVPTIDGGKTKVKIPEGTQSGRRFRLQGKGMPVLRARQIRRHVCPGRGRDAAEADQEAARAIGRIRPAVVDRNAARNRRDSSARSRSSSTGSAAAPARLEPIWSLPSECFKSDTISSRAKACTRFFA